MFEMFEIILKIILLIGLFGIAWVDYRTKLIETRWLWAIALTGLILTLGQNGATVTGQIFAGMLPGGLLLLFAWISGESIGFGDGWLFVVTGIFSGLQKNILYGTIVFKVCCKRHKSFPKLSEKIFQKNVTKPHVHTC